jgi:dienelactone hydrolase
LRSRLGIELGSVVDGAVLTALRIFDRPTTVRTVEGLAAHFAEVAAFYAGLGERFFVEPPPAQVSCERRGRLPDGEILDLAWPSEYEPRWQPVRSRYLGFSNNRRACARLFRHKQGPRPLLVCLHGYRGGQFFVEERAFPTRWLYSLGFDVALVTLPFHALRADRDTPLWPSAHPAPTNEGFGQAIFDLRALIRWLAAPSVSVSGMSLGGYTTALLATIERLAFAAPIIPVANFADIFWHHSQGSAERARAEREGMTLEILRAALAIHTPVLRTPRLAPERVLVISAEADRIAPPEHAERLARHFGCVEVRMAGSHVLQLGRGHAFGAIRRKVEELGIIKRLAPDGD